MRVDASKLSVERFHQQLACVFSRKAGVSTLGVGSSNSMSQASLCITNARRCLAMNCSHISA